MKLDESNAVRTRNAEFYPYISETRRGKQLIQRVPITKTDFTNDMVKRYAIGERNFNFLVKMLRARIKLSSEDRP